MDKEFSSEKRHMSLRRSVAAYSFTITAALLALHGHTSTRPEASANTVAASDTESSTVAVSSTTTTEKHTIPSAWTAPEEFIVWAAQEYHTDPGRALCIAQRESNMSPTAVNTWDSNAQKGVPSQGMFQFVQPTADYVANHTTNVDAWHELGMTYTPHGVEVTNSALISANWTRPDVQTLLFYEAQQQGLASHWNTHNPTTEC